MKKRIAAVVALMMAVALVFSSAAAVIPGIGSVEGKNVVVDVEKANVNSAQTQGQSQISDNEATEQQTQTAETMANPNTQKSNGDVPINHCVTIGGKEYDLLTFSGAVGALINVRSVEQLKYFAFSYLDYGVTKLLCAVADAVPMPSSIVDVDKYVSEDFYDGTDNFLNEPAKEARWSLGYSQASLLPDDLLNGKKDYYLAGYLLQNLPANTVETVLDDMKVRTICLDDGSGRGISTYSTIECVGLLNGDVREIRSHVVQYLEAQGIKININSININATHSHSEIDTMGLWNPLFEKIANNVIVNKTGKGEILTGTDPEFMATLYDRVAKTIVEASQNMTRGKMYSAQMDIEKYAFDKRDPDTYLTDLTRLRFVPDDRSIEETIIVNMAAHPYTTGLKTDNSSGKELSADYTYYMDEIITQAGYNFMFFQGAINGIYSERTLTNDGLNLARRSEQAVRYGHELGRMTLAMTMTKAQIEADKFLANKEQVEADRLAGGVNFTLWYENWQPVKETEVAPILNIRLKEVKLTVENPVIMAVGKLGLVNYKIFKDTDGTYCAFTEIGYLEIGNDLHIAFMPGEFAPELVTGTGAATADGSFSQQAFPYPSMNEIAGEDLLVFGLANDEIGYIVPDNDYCMIFFEGVKPFGDHYQETISFGRHTASTLIGSFSKLIDEIKEIRK